MEQRKCRAFQLRAVCVCMCVFINTRICRSFPELHRGGDKNQEMVVWAGAQCLGYDYATAT